MKEISMVGYIKAYCGSKYSNFKLKPINLLRADKE